MDELSPAQRFSLDQLSEEYKRRYEAAILFLKEQVGDGEVYENEVARIVISANGCWSECKDLTSEFSGTSGAAPDYCLLTDDELGNRLGEIQVLTSEVNETNTTLLSLFGLYSRTGIVDKRNVWAFHFDHPAGNNVRKPTTVGGYDGQRLPLFFRARIDSELGRGTEERHRATYLALTGVGERNLWVEMRYEAEPVVDLGRGGGGEMEQ